MLLKVLAFCSVPVLVGGFVSSGYAQSNYPGILIGPVGGVNFVFYHTDPFPILDLEPTKWVAQNGSGTDGFYGVSCLFPIGDEYQNFIPLELGLDSKSAQFSAPSNAPASLSSKLEYYVLNVGVKHNFSAWPAPRGLGIQLMASIGMRDWANYDRLLNPDIQDTNATRENAGRSLFIASIPNAAGLRIAIRGEVTYDIPLLQNPGMVLTPSIGWDQPLTKVDADNNWTANALYCSLSLRFLLFEEMGAKL